MRLGIVAYIVPFVFVFHPALLFKGTITEIVTAIVTASIGVIFLATGVAGYLFKELGYFKRALLILAGASLIPPASSTFWLLTNCAGILLGVALVTAEWSSASKHQVRLANMDQV
jgi:TRAP-type uncharacterized transport system fused permease subunit